MTRIIDQINAGQVGTFHRLIGRCPVCLRAKSVLASADPEAMVACEKCLGKARLRFWTPRPAAREAHFRG